MNKQGKLINGKVVGGIEWTKTILPDGTERQGFTWNPVGGCKHRCRWSMPDGTIAICYAEEVANGIAQSHYPDGFEAHYYHPKRLAEPLGVKEPSKIFLDSMADLMGYRVPVEQIDAVLNICRSAHWHRFQLLTKNAPRLLQFDFPPNVWAGVSMPPSFMWGRELSQHQQEAKFRRDMDVLSRIKASVKWVSFEPVAFDVAPVLAEFSGVLSWAVIGAASNGPKYYQPNRAHVMNLLDVLDRQGVSVFFKGNLDWQPWREEFPQAEATPAQAGAGG